jgi:hypothetical protein
VGFSLAAERRRGGSAQGALEERERERETVRARARTCASERASERERERARESEREEVREGGRETARLLLHLSRHDPAFLPELLSSSHTTQPHFFSRHFSLLLTAAASYRHADL